MIIPTPDGFLVGASDRLAAYLQRRGIPLPLLLAACGIAFLASVALGFVLHLSQARYVSAGLWLILVAYAVPMTVRTVIRSRADAHGWDAGIAAAYRARADMERERWASRGVKALVLAVAWGVVATRFPGDPGTLSRAVAVLAPLTALALGSYAKCARPITVPPSLPGNAGA